jgi:hypothetical protein
MEPVTILLLILAVALVLVGLAGLVLPALPGGALVFGGLLLAAWAEEFAYVGWGALTVIAVLAMLIFAVDFIATLLGVKKVGASRQAVVGAFLGTLAGLFLGPVGLLFGPFVGAFAGELAARDDHRQAMRAGLGAWLGFVVGSALKLALGALMVGVYLAVRFFF